MLVGFVGFVSTGLSEEDSADTPIVTVHRGVSA